MQTHDLMGGKLHVYKRDNSRFWQCSAYLSGKNRRRSTKEESLAHAKEFAEDWYLELRGKARSGELKNEKLFKDASKIFLREIKAFAEDNRNPHYVGDQEHYLNKHLLPYFGNMGLSEVNSGAAQEYRIHRRETSIKEHGKPPAYSTIHKEIVCLRLVLKTAIRHGLLDRLPDLSEPYRKSVKISHRAWFSPDEYKKLYEATRKRAQNPKHPRHVWHSKQFHDFILFMVNTGLRPDEAYKLQYRDVSIIKDEDTDETILLIEVRGKRGVGYCKSMPGAVQPFKRLRERNKPDPSDLVFPNRHREILNTVLDELDLKHDRDGNPRTSYSLRHTYICLRLLEGADIYQVAKNCRTSVEMIEKYYASHLENMLDASAINVRKSKPKVKDLTSEK